MTCPHGRPDHWFCWDCAQTKPKQPAKPLSAEFHAHAKARAEKLVAHPLFSPNGTFFQDAMAYLDQDATAAALRAQLTRCEEEIAAWRHCALYDPMMEGPRFKAWDRSALDRCRRRYIEAAAIRERKPA